MDNAELTLGSGRKVKIAKEGVGCVTADINNGPKIYYQRIGNIVQIIGDTPVGITKKQVKKIAYWIIVYLSE